MAAHKEKKIETQTSQRRHQNMGWTGVVETKGGVNSVRVNTMKRAYQVGHDMGIPDPSCLVVPLYAY
jgi:hypothetical protein